MRHYTTYNRAVAILKARGFDERGMCPSFWIDGKGAIAWALNEAKGFRISGSRI